MGSPLEIEEAHGSGLYPRRGLTLVRGQGAYVWDQAGRRYLDCVAGVGVANLGHAHPAVTAAIREQAGRLVTCYESFANDARAALYGELAACVPAGLDRYFLCNSGTEAVEAALKLSRAATGRQLVLSFKRGYHGKTFGALSATPVAAYQKPVSPLLEGFYAVKFGDREALEGFFAAHGHELACVLVELIQGEGGVHVAPDEFVVALRRLTREYGALLVVDEVQTGVGRTGRTWCSEHHDLAPDMLCAAKALGGGVPLGLCAFRDDIGELPSRLHSSTFGGNPLSCAAGAAVLRTLREDELPARAARLGARLADGIRGLELRIVREVRGRGLMVGVDLRRRAGPFLAPLAAAGVLALLAGSTVLRLLPPLVIDEPQVDGLVATLKEVLSG